MGLHVVSTVPKGSFCTAFSKAVARRVGEKTAFLFGNFFFVPLVSKKKWMKDKQLL